MDFNNTDEKNLNKMLGRSLPQLPNLYKSELQGKKNCLREDMFGEKKGQ